MIENKLSDRALDIVVLLIIFGIAVVGWFIGFCLSISRRGKDD